MMHRYAIWCICLPQNVAKPRIIGRSRHHWRSQHHLPKANIIQKTHFCLMTKVRFLLALNVIKGVRHHISKCIMKRSVLIAMPPIKHISQNPWEYEDLSLRWNQEYQLELTDHKPLKSHQRAIGMPKISRWSWNKAAVTIIEIIIAILKKIYACLYLLGGVKRYTPITSFTCIIPYFNS